MHQVWLALSSRLEVVILRTSTRSLLISRLQTNKDKSSCTILNHAWTLISLMPTLTLLSTSINVNHQSTRHGDMMLRTCRWSVWQTQIIPVWMSWCPSRRVVLLSRSRTVMLVRSKNGKLMKLHAPTWVPLQEMHLMMIKTPTQQMTILRNLMRPLILINKLRSRMVAVPLIQQNA